MNAWRQNGHGTGESGGLDDATVEELLAGRYQGDDPSLVAVSQFLEHVRSFAARAVSHPSAALAQALSDSVPPAGHDLARPNRRSLTRALRSQRAGRRDGKAARRFRTGQLLTLAAAATTVLVAVVGAGSVGVLPGRTQDMMERIVRTVTPFHFRDEREPRAVVSESPSAGGPPARPAGTTPAPGSPPQAQAEHSSENRPRSTTPTHVDVGPPPSGLAAVAPPTTLAARPAPTAGGVGGRSSDDVPSVPSTVARPSPRGNHFSAALSGTSGSQTSGDPDGRGTAVLDVNPGRDELCLTLDASDLAPVTSVHLHAGGVDVSGSVVVDFGQVTTGASTCRTVDDEVIKRVRKEPEKYYIDVHTSEFPTGALRGQLTR